MIYTNRSVKVSTSDVFPHKFNFNDHHSLSHRHDDTYYLF